MKYLLMMAMLGISTAFAQSEPVTRIKGDNDASYKIAPNLKVPYKQATKINSTTVRVETGNDNILKDPSFESGVLPVNTGSPANVGDVVFSCTNGVVPTVSTDAIAVDGTKVLSFQFGGGLVLFTQVCTYTTKIPSALIGTPVELSFNGYVSGTEEAEVCAYDYASASDCKYFQEVDTTKNKKYVFSITPTTDTVYLRFARRSSNLETAARNAKVDSVYIGKPKSAEAIVANFTIDSKRLPCTFSTLSWTGLGAVTTNNLSCSRDGKYLVIEGNVITSGVSANIVEIPLPNNFGSISVAPNSINYNVPVGMYLKNATSSEHGGGVVINSILGPNIYLTHGGTFSSTSLNSTDRALGTTVGSSINLVGVRIPIAEWQDSYNAALVTCEKGPAFCTNTISLKRFSPDLFATDQFGNTYPVTKGANAGYSIVNVSSLGLANPMICTPTISGGSNFFGWTTVLNPVTNTQVTAYTVNGSGTTAVDAGFFMTCTKTGTDNILSLENFAGYLPLNDVKNTEWVVGYDWIDNKPIYKRCHKVVSDVTGTTATLATWGTNLNPINSKGWHQTNSWYSLGQLTGTAPASNYVYTWYIPSSGALFAEALGVYRLKAGEKICMEYTR